MAERNHRLIDGKVSKYLLPSVMLTMALQLGNVVDTILVGNLLGIQAMSAIRLCSPMMIFEQVVCSGLGAGAAICAGIRLGKRDREGASAVFSLVFWLALGAGLLFAGSAFFLAEPVAHLLAGNGPLTELTRQYLFVWMLGGPIIGAGLYLVHFMGVESHPGLSSTYIILANVINLVLDYLLLAFTPLGIIGAALSTMLGYLLAMLVYVKYFKDRNRMLRLSAPKSLRPLSDAVKAGTPTLMYMGMNIIDALGSNAIILHLLGVNGMTIYTVCMNILLITLMLTGGVTGIIPSLSGVLYGEKDFYGLRAVCVRTMKITAAVTAVLLAVVTVFTPQLAAAFGIRQMPLSGYTISALRCFMLCLPFYVWNRFLTSYYQSIEQTRQASLIVFLQNGAIRMPAIFIGITVSLKLGHTGFNAMGLSFLISEVLTVLISSLFRKISYPGKGIFILPGENSGDCLDLTIEARPGEVPPTSCRIQQFSLEKGVEPNEANRMTMAAEEMMINAITYGGKTSQWLDVCLVVEPEELRLRIRDNGVPFDPTSYEYDGDEYDINGIEIVKRIASRISYVRAIDLNSTVIEIDRRENLHDQPVRGTPLQEAARGQDARRQ